jgi:hypothetical protein
MPRTKKIPEHLDSIINRKKCFGNQLDVKRILFLLASSNITSDEALRLLGNLSMYLLNTYSRITTPSIPIERFLNQLKIHLIIAQMNFSNIRTCVQAINTMTFNVETFDGMSLSVFELLQHCSMIESLITQIDSTFGMIRMIIEQIIHESCQRLVLSITFFRKTFDQFVNEFVSKKEEIIKFLRSSKLYIESIIRNSDTESSLESKIQDVGSSLSTALSNQCCIESVIRSHQTDLTMNQNRKTNLIESLKCLIEEYVSTRSARQIKFPNVTQINEILRIMSSISPKFERYHQSDSSPTVRTYEQNIFDSRMKKGLDMIHAMITNHRIKGLRKLCAYLNVLLKHCYERLRLKSRN